MKKPKVRAVRTCHDLFDYAYKMADAELSERLKNAPTFYECYSLGFVAGFGFQYAQLAKAKKERKP